MEGFCPGCGALVTDHGAYACGYPLADCPAMLVDAEAGGHEPDYATLITEIDAEIDDEIGGMFEIYG